MKITHNIISDEIIQKLEEQDQKNKLQGEILESLKKKKISIIENIIDQMSPVYGWIIKNTYYFVHPDSIHKTLIGPILYDDGNYLYTLSDKKNFVIKKDVFTNVENELPLKDFIEFCPFEDLVSGLLYPREMLGKYIKDNEAEIRSNEREIGKYEVWLNS
ncbi:hypothetical protein SLL00_16600 [Metabacillus indicus]|uniref:hypothetical protein n=1 Tax=Metabacillus indicus TaxID=246786 RepID=UPI002A08E44B|nr:hypothetical protein [Metabacillus indicus]MDX8291432.1 hypothetical protein [Metabacillus indicus]